MKNNVNNLMTAFKVNKFLYMLVFLMMLVSDDSFWFGVSEIESLVFVKFAFIAALPILLYSYKSKFFFIGNNGVVAVVFVSFLLMLSSFVNSFKLFSGTTLAVFLLIAGFLFVRKFPFQLFGKTFSDVTLVIIGYSLLIYLVIVTNVISPSSITNVGGYEYRTFGGCLYTFNGVFYRNSAIFREAGMFMIFINMAFLFDILIMQSIPTIKIMFYGIGILTTFSTGGIFTFFTLLLLYVLKGRKSKNTGLVVIAAVVAIYIAIGSEDFMDTIFGKLESGLDNGSTLNRWATMVIPLYIMNNPIFGCGFDNYADMFRMHSQKAIGFFVDESGSTNTIMSSGAIWGIWMSVFWIVTLWLFSKRFVEKNNTYAILIFVALFMMFSNEVRYFSAFSYIIAFYGIGGMYKIKEKKYGVQKQNSQCV